MAGPVGGSFPVCEGGSFSPARISPNGSGANTLREELAPTGPAIGLLLNAPYRLAETVLKPGDLLFAFTDGVTEARNPAAEEFGQERLESLLTAHAGPAEDLLAEVETAVREHTAGAEAFEDVTMLALHHLTDEADE